MVEVRGLVLLLTLVRSTVGLSVTMGFPVPASTTAVPPPLPADGGGSGTP